MLVILLVFIRRFLLGALTQVSHRVTRIELDTPDQVTWADGGDSKPSYRKVTKIEVWGGNSHNSYTKLTPELDVQVCQNYLSLNRNKRPRTKTVYLTQGIINRLRDACYVCIWVVNLN